MGCSATPSSWRIRFGRSGEFFALALVILLSKQISASGGEGIVHIERTIENPHGNVMLCTSCHISAIGGRNTMKFGKKVSQLCQSCHNGQIATQEIHPVEVVPGKKIAGKIPSDFPLEDGKLTCLTCHDVTWDCTAGQTTSIPNRNLLRGDLVSSPLDFCFHCHIQENYQTFNAHDQLEDGKMKTDACLWCHISTPEISPYLKDTTSYKLRGEVIKICGNCHFRLISNSASDTHSHMYLSPSQEMKWYMFAYEIQPQMHLPFKQLMEYVRAANRAPRSIPLNKDDCITCWSCHNPHEQGILPATNPRSIGAEPEKSTNYRLRTREGDISCRMCHQK